MDKTKEVFSFMMKLGQSRNFFYIHSTYLTLGIRAGFIQTHVSKYFVDEQKTKKRKEERKLLYVLQ